MVKINSRLDTVEEKIREFKTHSNRKYLKRNIERKEKKNRAWKNCGIASNNLMNV